MNAWLVLLVGGCFEVGFTTFMKLSDGFQKLPFTIGFLVCALLSFVCLSKASMSIPLGTAYAVWTGIGACGTAIIGIWIFMDPTNFARVFFLCTLIASLVGLKLASR